MPTFTRKHIAIARAAGALVGVSFDATAERTAEQQNAYAALFAAIPNAADAAACYSEAAKPDIAKRQPLTPKQADAVAKAKAPAKPKPEPKPEAAKPEKPAKPHADAKADDYDARVKLVAELRESVSRLYNGPSLAVRSNPKRIAASVYSDLHDAPKHRTTLDRVSVRDESALAEIIKRGDASGGFDPVALNLDSGIFSRLRSVGFIERAPASAKLPYRLTKPGAEHAGKAAKRAA